MNKSFILSHLDYTLVMHGGGGGGGGWRASPTWYVPASLKTSAACSTQGTNTVAVVPIVPVHVHM